MVKGVNKTVIEVNNTGSKMFEKIVLYVTPEYGNLSAKQLRKAAGNLVTNFEDMRNCVSLRKRVKRKRMLVFSSIAASAVVLLTTLLIVL